MSLQRRAVLASAVLASAVLAAAPAWTQEAQAALPAEVAADLPAARVLGRGRITFFGLQVYDVRLWLAQATLPAEWHTAPFALELVYARSLSGSMIADRSLTEMKRQGDIAADVAQRWLETMKAAFPDVKDGDRITGLNLPGRGARFYFNGSLRSEPRDSDFARVFFGIWLSPKTSEPALRKALLGLAS